MRVICTMCKIVTVWRCLFLLYAMCSSHLLCNVHVTCLFPVLPHIMLNNHSPTGSETHFKVIIASSHFTSKTPIAKHRLVNNVLKDELDGPVHALSIVAMTPEKYAESLERGDVIGNSPSCRGGDGSLPKKNG